MAVCDLRNGHEKSSALGPTSFSGFLLSKSKISGNDEMLFDTFQKIISDHLEVTAIK